MNPDLPSQRPLELRGLLAGREARLRLYPGASRLGSDPDGDLVLDGEGISRRHALIEAGPGGARVTDLDSKNGTWVNGRRIRSARLDAGDEVRFGKTAFRVEALADDEAVLAVELPAGPSPTPNGRARETSTHLSVLRGGANALTVLEGAVELLSRPRVLYSALAAHVAESLGADVCWVLERPRDASRVAVLAVAGEPDPEAELVARRCLSEALSDEERPPTRTCASFRAEEPVPVTGAVVGTRAGQLGLVVCGQPSLGDDTERLLRIVALLLAREQESPGTAGGPFRDLDRTNRAAPGIRIPSGIVVGTDPAMASIYDQMGPLAAGDLPVLILGETGVGKEHLAQILHDSSPRSAGLRVAINCAAIPAEQLEAELFGIASGAATGVDARDGLFLRAHGGTLFLDEIGDLGPELQVKLLRALQQKEIQPVGGAPVPVDARVVSATNADLEVRVAAGRFRADLYYRLAGAVLRVPPLRSRPSDLPRLVEHFLRAACEETGRRVRGVSLRAMRGLTAYAWPGNVRELEHEVCRLVHLCPDGQVIDAELLAPPIAATVGLRTVADAAREASEPPRPDRFNLARAEKALITEALRTTGGVLAKAADLLGISRDALRRRLQRHGIVDRKPVDRNP